MSIWGKLLGVIAKHSLKGFIEQSNKELSAINLAYDKIIEIWSKS